MPQLDPVARRVINEDNGFAFAYLQSNEVESRLNGHLSFGPAKSLA